MKIKQPIGLYYITQEDVPNKTEQQLVEEACEAGIQWIQLRIKKKNGKECLKIAKEVAKIINSYPSKLIINDSISIAKNVKSEGIHLGKNDTPIEIAREQLGDGYIIGGTANNEDDFIRLINSSVDYIGFGPFRFTSTKQNLTPVLGLAQMVEIMERNPTNIPIVCIGGIKIDDVGAIIKSGFSGVAVSSALNFAENFQKETINFIDECNKAFNH
jgi:thiamine-phosphate pyrophosphorylase